MESPLSAHRRLPLGWSTWFALLVCGVGTYFGWQLLWHMADDAYITFRYASNAMAGRGLVWNPEPFVPVDGNTYFLWSLVLLGVWKVFGVVPPDAANTISLLFGFLTLLLLARAVARLRLPQPLERWRSLLVWLVLLFVSSNRVFLASLSSGLGIAMFNCCLLAWALLAASPRTVDSKHRWFLLATIAAVSGLCRPEGHLVVAATCAVIALWSLGPTRRFGSALGAMTTAALPIVAHLVWRRVRFGEWMPCPYYAKTVEAWPESGARFFASFVVEFGVYVWLATALFWLVQKVRTGGPRAMFHREHLGAATVVGVLLFHFAYYTFFMGGDLFEWRVYSHLIPLLPLALVAMARDLSSRPVLAVGSLGLFLVLAQPVAWIKCAFDDGAVAPHLPAMLRPLVQPYDAWQRWLNERAVCMRNFHMKENFAILAKEAPSREEGERIAFDGFPVHATPTVGITGWVLPNVAIIDIHGLNDWVIARTPVPNAEQRLASRIHTLVGEFEAFDHDHDHRVTVDEFRPFLAALKPDLARTPESLQQAAVETIAGFDLNGDGSVTRDEYVEANHPHGDRYIAHDRMPPPGYVEGFRPNVTVFHGKVTVEPRAVPLTEPDIRQHEATFRARFGGH